MQSDSIDHIVNEIVQDLVPNKHAREILKEYYGPTKRLLDELEYSESDKDSLVDFE